LRLSDTVVFFKSSGHVLSSPANPILLNEAHQ
jgi:hypothetical protein